MSSKPFSKIDVAWTAFFATQVLDDLDALRKEGWRTPEDLAEGVGANLRGLRDRLKRDAKLESRKVRLVQGGGARVMNVYRPKVLANAPKLG